MSGNPKPLREDNTRNLPISRYPRGKIATTYPSYQAEEIMYLERAGTLAKQSYIQVKHVYSIPLSKLVNLGCPKFENRLSEESYSHLMKVLKLEKSQWMQTLELESGGQDPSTVAPKLKAGLPTLTNGSKILTPGMALEEKSQMSVVTSPVPPQSNTITTPSLQKGKKARKFKAVAGHDFLSNMVCAFQ
ncbi:hypothetical protein ONS95_008719 [Cadophora gregata]|uniref:uncharacterized protein n=1 Tax=Cadophora gregata TaxID=51156 RepID=UPI0026DC98CB|nr:uncharacterized protein ONS95_008719 [Cadophora gregata]KAK0123710.1 hypothetical protein ONS95_008719 [Cadophora gregata]KAK0130054.1 hypothetical protein ONS96_000591 [Cadophora gregata f. sp. sojae]